MMCSYLGILINFILIMVEMKTRCVQSTSPTDVIDCSDAFSEPTAILFGINFTTVLPHVDSHPSASTTFSMSRRLAGR